MGSHITQIYECVETDLGLVSSRFPKAYLLFQALLGVVASGMSDGAFPNSSGYVSTGHDSEYE